MRTLTTKDSELIFIDYLTSLTKEPSGVIATMNTGQRILVLPIGEKTSEHLDIFIFYLNITITRENTDEIYTDELITALYNDGEW